MYTGPFYELSFLLSNGPLSKQLFFCTLQELDSRFIWQFQFVSKLFCDVITTTVVYTMFLALSDHRSLLVDSSAVHVDISL